MNQVNHTEEFHMNQPIDKLFPLFSPEGERLWVPNWNYENIMGTTELKEDYIFITKSHDHGTTEAVWLVKKYDPKSHFVQFYKVEVNDKVGIISVKCNKLDQEETLVSVTYEYIALSQSGREFIDGFTQKEYRQFIAEWKSLLDEYFKKN